MMMDELDNANPNVLTAMNSALANGHANFPDSRVNMHPDFICVAAGNTYGRGADRLYVGRQQLDAASLDRFLNLSWDYDEDAEFDWAGKDQKNWTTYVQACRKVAATNQMRVVISPRASIFGAKLLRAGIDGKVVEEAALWKGMNVADREKIESSVVKFEEDWNR